MVDNRTTTPSDILDSFSINLVFGDTVTYNPSFEKSATLKDGTNNNLTISFVDQNFNPIVMIDSNVTITLLIKLKLKSK